MHRLLFHERTQCCERAFLSNQRPKLAPWVEGVKNIVVAHLGHQRRLLHSHGLHCSWLLLFSQWWIHGLFVPILPLTSWWRRERRRFHWKILAMEVSSCSLCPPRIGGILASLSSSLMLWSLPILKMKQCIVWTTQWGNIMWKIKPFSLNLFKYVFVYINLSYIYFLSKI